MVGRYTRISREYIFFLGLFAFLILYLIIGYGASLIVNLLGFLYPVYKSYVQEKSNFGVKNNLKNKNKFVKIHSCKAIDSDEKDDDTQWLTYWVVYATFTILEHFTDYLLAWVPFYFLAKVSYVSNVRTSFFSLPRAVCSVCSSSGACYR